MNTPSTIREQAAQIDAGAEALRQRLQGGKTLRPWPQIPNSSKKKWREYATVVLAAAAITLPEQTKGEEGWRTMESAPKDCEILVCVSGRVETGKWTWDEEMKAPRPFWRYSYILGKESQRQRKPTHWMPLPIPPASSIPSKKEDG